MKELASRAKKLDPTRLVTAAVFAERKGKTFTVKDPLARSLDVVGVNEYAGWYSDKVKDVPKLRWRSRVGRPVVISEFGAGARAGLQGKADERWTENYQAEVYKAQLDMIERIKFVRGASPWILADFRSPLRMNRHQQGYNRKGLVSDQGVRKLAFQVVRDRYEKWRKKWEK
jgi:beta-glucuronidase